MGMFTNGSKTEEVTPYHRHRADLGDSLLWSLRKDMYFCRVNVNCSIWLALTELSVWITIATTTSFPYGNSNIVAISKVVELRGDTWWSFWRELLEIKPLTFPPIPLLWREHKSQASVSAFVLFFFSSLVASENCGSLSWPYLLTWVCSDWD